jgi:hypothetical protein
VCERREHRDVQAGDGHEVVHAGAREEIPLRRRNRPLVADGQRDEDAGEGGGSGEQAIAHPAAKMVDPGAGRPRIESAAHDGLAVVHVARRADALLEEPRLAIEAVRIHRTVRTLQPDRELETLTGHHRRGRGDGIPRVPREQHPARRVAVRGERAIDAEAEAPAVIARFGQALDDAGHAEIAAFVGTGEFVGEFPGGHECGPEEAGGAPAGQRERRGGSAQQRNRGSLPGDCREPRDEHDAGSGQRRQRRLLLQPPGPGDERAGVEHGRRDTGDARPALSRSARRRRAAARDASARRWRGRA